MKAATTAIQIMAGITGGFVAAVNLLGSAVLSVVGGLATMAAVATATTVSIARPTASLVVASALKPRTPLY